MKRTYFFTAPWCKACAPVKLEWVRAIRKFPDIERHEINVSDDGAVLAQDYGVQGLPTIVLVNHDSTVHEMFSPYACATMNTVDFETKLWHWR